MTVAQYFTNDTTDARRKFLAACLDARLPVISFESPKLKEGIQPVQIDIAFAGTNNATAALVVCPGKYVSEALCASGIQTALLRTGLGAELPSSMGLVLIHITDPSVFEISNSEITIGNDLIATKWDDSLLAAAEITFNENMRQSQLPAPAESERQKWCKQVLSDITERFLLSAQRLLFLDVHTGAGRHGEMDIVSCNTRGSDAEVRAVRWFGARVTSSNAATVNLQGPIAMWLSSTLLERQITSIVVEFGCYSLTTILDSLISQREVKASGGCFDPLYYPNSDEWRDSVWKGAEEILRLGFRATGLGVLMESG